jgi:hypothetical protein
MSSLFAAALVSCAGAGAAIAATATTGPATAVTATAAGKSAESAFLRAFAARFPAGSAVGRVAAAYLGRLAAERPQASRGTMDVTAGTGISCASVTACLSVGVHLVQNNSSQSETSFAARLHAGAWKAVPVKTPKGAKLATPSGVSCKSATYCLVLGDGLASSSFGFVPFALTWNGTTLTPIAAPPMPAHMFGLAASVSCVAVNRCVAIGSASSITTGANVQIIWVWNGTRWARTTVPDANPNVMTEYKDLHCFSLTSCIAIGDSTDITVNGSPDTPVAEAWNGTTFTDLAAPLPTGLSYPLFNGLSCVSVRSCAVVGIGSADSAGTDTIAFAELWNGKTWTVTKWAGPKGDTDAELIDVSCTSAVRCIAVGTHGTAKTAGPAALAWTDSKWTVLKVPSPGAGKAADFEAVSCPANGRCATTGETGDAAMTRDTPIAGYWNGSTWKYGPMLPATAI